MACYEKAKSWAKRGRVSENAPVSLENKRDSTWTSHSAVKKVEQLKAGRPTQELAHRNS